MASQSQVSNAIPAPNYTQIPNVVLEYWANRLRENELRVLLLICRLTFGWHRSSVEMSLKEMERSLGRSLTVIKRALIGLENFGLIERDRQQEANGDYRKTRYKLKIQVDAGGGARAPSGPGGRAASDPSSLIKKKRKKEARSSERAEAAEKKAAPPARSPAGDFQLNPDKTPKPSLEGKNPKVGETPASDTNFGEGTQAHTGEVPRAHTGPDGSDCELGPTRTDSDCELGPTRTDSDMADTLSPPAWHAELKSWLEANGQVYTRLDQVMFSRIAGALSASLLAGFYVAAGAVSKPRGWGLYLHVAREVAARGAVKLPPGRAELKEQRVREWAERVSANWEKYA